MFIGKAISLNAPVDVVNNLIFNPLYGTIHLSIIRLNILPSSTRLELVDKLLNKRFS